LDDCEIIIYLDGLFLDSEGTISLNRKVALSSSLPPQ